MEDDEKAKVDPARPEPRNPFERPDTKFGQTYDRTLEAEFGRTQPSGHPLTAPDEPDAGETDTPTRDG